MDIIGNIGYLLENYWSMYLRGIASTLILAIVGTFVGLFIGIFLAFGKNMKVSRGSKPIRVLKAIVKGFCCFYSTVLRGTPMMVQAMIFKYGCQFAGVNWNNILPGNYVLNGWLIAGLIVITFNTAAYMCEIVRSGLNGIDNGEIEAARSLGMSSFQALMLVALPQALRNSLPTIGNEWIVNIKDSSVLNIIGVTELFFLANQAATKGYMFMATYIIIAVIYLTLTLLSTIVLKYIENKMDGKKQEKTLELNNFEQKGEDYGYIKN